MNATGKIAERTDPKALLSTLWIIVMINMLKADVLSLYIPGVLDELARTSTGAGIPIAQLMLFGAVMGELAIVMIVLSRVLPLGANRLANMIVSANMIAYIWAGAVAYPHYTFIASVETLCLLFIIWTAWKWRNPAG